ncbi:ABC transporter substrate-binding protein [Allokutzneria sp. A3M-2-11 16]|uniref:ABC transporter substrate-binding protein n=1 Tax=Allokutzneria sp. A3M-2-11 16 TaxID=2962043 RepID=UPI0020B84158|nr:ABC transporter substrate-binding protein [Allokutzneria sp. A3M-2-11 16]MCP3803435.1 ABC transporter substrate-binding protein [Allokutzneria sp. A3M-2-11 16]
MVQDKASGRVVSRRSVLTGGAAVVSAALAGPGVATAGARAASARPIKVGVLLDLSGPGSGHGERQLLGLRRMRDMVESGALPGHRPVTLVERDTKGTAAATAAAAAALIEQDRVDGLIGTSSPFTVGPLRDAAQAAGVPMVNPLITGLADPTNTFVFTSRAPFGLDLIKAIARDARRDGLRRTATLIGSAWTGPKFDEDLARLAGFGLDNAGVAQFGNTETDFRPQLKQLIAARPDTISVFGLPPSNGLAVAQARELGWTKRIYCSPSASHPLFFSTAGPAAEGVRVLVPWATVHREAPPELPNLRTMRLFASTFEEQHGQPGAYPCFAADALGMLTKAYASTDDRAQARDRLETLSYKGVTGVYTPGNNHVGLPEGTLTTAIVRGGRFVLDA